MGSAGGPGAQYGARLDPGRAPSPVPWAFKATGSGIFLFDCVSRRRFVQDNEYTPYFQFSALLQQLYNRPYLKYRFSPSHSTAVAAVAHEEALSFFTATYGAFVCVRMFLPQGGYCMMHPLVAAKSGSWHFCVRVPRTIAAHYS